MDGSAAVIGEMMLPILEPPDLAAATPPARALGEAFQLTNFLRDIAEDLDRGRQYVPQEDLARFGVDLTERRCTPEFVDADAVRDRALPRAVPPRRGGHRHAARALGAVRRAPPTTSTAGSSTASRPRATTCSPAGARADARQARRRGAAPARPDGPLDRRVGRGGDGGRDDRLPARRAAAAPPAGRSRTSSSAGWRRRRRRRPRPAGARPHGARRVGGRRDGTAAVERVGTSTGWPFGRYRYTGRLRPEVAGVPAIVPAGVVGDGRAGARGRPRRARAADRRGSRRIALGAAALTAWDLFLDPQMTAEGYWRWDAAGPLPGHPAVELRRVAASTGAAVMARARGGPAARRDSPTRRSSPSTPAMAVDGDGRLRRLLRRPRSSPRSAARAHAAARRVAVRSSGSARPRWLSAPTSSSSAPASAGSPWRSGSPPPGAASWCSSATT